MIKALTLALALASPAGAFDLAWPVDCQLGQSCYIQHYMDHDPGPGAQDFTCGSLSYDGHDGTDIGLPNRAAMAAGVKVLAAGPGVVKATRDGVADFLPPVAGQECGNGVLIAHDAGWQTQYCHMKQGSVAVHPGDPVQAGTVLGQIGQSGMAEFPHLHLTLRHLNQPVDPFAATQSACGKPADTLWATPPAYRPGGFLAAGFSSAIPEFSAIQAGLDSPTLPTTAPALVIWAEVYGGQAGDQLRFAAKGPDGSPVLDGEATLTRTQDLLFRATGKTLRSTLARGAYQGEVTLLRKGVEIDRIATSATVD